ncbi:hypothetical protein V8Z74_14670 [Comamonas sp. w2-DMI]|uniref:ParB/RepB/Spo0J family partition protein n=1 Tax=Comamonas sp. w2-DMI TaxID=3126391 RepID=UPI0032E48D2A
MSVSDVDSPAGDEQVQLVLQPDLTDVVAVSTSEVDQLESDKAQKMLDFDDSTIRVLGHNEVPVIMRSTRLKAPLSVSLNDLYIVPGMNPRLDTEEWEQHINWLADQMISEGFRDDCPLLVFATTDPRTNRPVYGIISGESRFHAVARANKRGAQISAIPVTLAAEGMSVEEMTVQLATSNTGKPFSPLEQAILAQRFAKWGREPKEIANILKVSVAYVTQLLKIAKAPNKVRTMIKEGAVSFGAALAALNADPATAVATLEQTAQAAKAAGKKTGTTKFLPEQQATKAARAFGPQMQSFLVKLKSNEGVFALMDDEDRQTLDSILEEIKKMAERKPEDIAKAKAEKQAAKKAEREARQQKRLEEQAEKTPRKGKAQAATKNPGQAPDGGVADGSAADTPPQEPASSVSKKSTAKKPAAKAAPAKKATVSTKRVRDPDAQHHPED